jgi:CcmD family protein
MRTLQRWCAVVWLSIVWGIVVAAQQPTPKDEWIPLSELPAQDQLPAAPLLIAAYAFVLVALFLYVFSVARRLTNVQQELNRLDAAIKQGNKS